jgi:hypothetical protein
VLIQWARRWERPDNQEVGLEAATLERVRNSSLVEGSRADNVPGLKSAAEAQDAVSNDCVVGERRLFIEASAQAGAEERRVRMSG